MTDEQTDYKKLATVYRDRIEGLYAATLREYSRSLALTARVKAQGDLRLAVQRFDDQPADSISDQMSKSRLRDAVLTEALKLGRIK